MSLLASLICDQAVDSRQIFRFEWIFYFCSREVDERVNHCQSSGRCGTKLYALVSWLLFVLQGFVLPRGWRAVLFSSCHGL